MARWVEIDAGIPVYRIRDDRVVEINTGNPAYASASSSHVRLAAV